MKVVEMMKSFWNEEEGLTMVEYALVGALVAVAALTAFTTLGEKVSSTTDSISNSLK